MKKIIIIILLLSTLEPFAQVDSMKLKTSISLQVRDWLYLNSIIANNEQFENIYDSMKIRLRVTEQPSLTTVIQVDNIRNEQILRLSRVLKESMYATVTFAYSRINAALKANDFLIGKIAIIDAEFTGIYNDRIQSEINKLRANR